MLPLDLPLDLVDISCLMDQAVTRRRRVFSRRIACPDLSGAPGTVGADAPTYPRQKGGER